MLTKSRRVLDFTPVETWRLKGKTCPAILGLVEEGDEVMEEFEDSEALDAGILAGAQAVEHYEISRYGTLIAWAKSFGMNEAASLLDKTLQEEKATDVALKTCGSSD